MQDPRDSTTPFLQYLPEALPNAAETLESWALQDHICWERRVTSGRAKTERTVSGKVLSSG